METNLLYAMFKWVDILMSAISTFLGFYTGLVWTKSWKRGLVCLCVLVAWVLIDGWVWFSAMERMP